MDSAEFLARFATDAPDGVLYAGGDGKIGFWNAGCERIFGFTAQEALGQSLDIIIPGNLRARHWQGYDETLRTGQSRYGAGDLLSVPALRKDGARISVEFSIIPVRERRRPHARHGRHPARRHQTFRGIEGFAQSGRRGEATLGPHLSSRTPHSGDPGPRGHEHACRSSALGPGSRADAQGRDDKGARWSQQSARSEPRAALPRNLREIRHGLRRRADLRQQREAICAHGRVGRIHRHLVEERIDRTAQLGQRPHGAGEVLHVDGRARVLLHGFDGRGQP